MVSPTNFGFLACGVYRVSSWRRRQARLCGTLGFRLYERASTAVKDSSLPKVIDSLSAITTPIAGSASMDFPLPEGSYRPGRMVKFS